MSAMMATGAPALPVPSASRARLAAGLAVSIAAHAAAILALRPMTAEHVLSRPLQVELLSPAPADSASITAARSELEPVAAPERGAPAQEPPRSRRLEPASDSVQGLALRSVPDRYFTSREVDVRAEPANDIALIYPQLAYQRRIRGKVVLTLLISQRGQLDGVSVVNAEPAGFFEEAAVTAARQLRFSPAIRHGQPVKSRKTIEVIFDPYESIHIP